MDGTLSHVLADVLSSAEIVPSGLNLWASVRSVARTVRPLQRLPIVTLPVGDATVDADRRAGFEQVASAGATSARYD